MNMRLIIQSFCLIVCVVCLGEGRIRAQSDSSPAPEPVPVPPWVAAPPEDSQWRITVKPTKDNAAKAANPGEKKERQLQEVLCQKVDKIKRDVQYFSDGTTDEYLYVDGKELMPLRPGSKEIMVSTGGDGGSPDMNMRINPVSSKGFAGVAWIKEGDYRDTVQYLTVKCFHYVRDAESWEAWVDVDTKMPVAFKTKDALYVYSFENPPTSLALPSAYQHVYEDDHKRTQYRQRLMHDLGGQ